MPIPIRIPQSGGSAYLSTSDSALNRVFRQPRWARLKNISYIRELVFFFSTTCVVRRRIRFSEKGWNGKTFCPIPIYIAKTSWERKPPNLLLGPEGKSE